MPQVNLTLPDWMGRACEEYIQSKQPEQWMAFVIYLSKMNVINKTGGPFGAAIIEIETGRLIAPGVNRVVPLSGSIWHGEMVAIALAQKELNTFDLASVGNFALVTSCSPCAMCYGATPWSGVKMLVYGASSDDAESIGFGEGYKPKDWSEYLESINIKVLPLVMQKEAKGVLDLYALQGNLIYNSSIKEK
jgi:tRNA(Arg) A34 adenosine deaminase TadA